MSITALKGNGKRRNVEFLKKNVNPGLEQRIGRGLRINDWMENENESGGN
jgi:hypothetical protein